MKRIDKLLIVLALASTFWAGTVFGQSRLPGAWTFPDKVVDDLSIIHAGTWSYACESMNMTAACRDLVPPRVAYGLLAYRYGEYDIGSRTVVVDIRLLFQQVAVGVLHHEMVHYLQGKRDPLRGSVVTHEQACLDEQEAHKLTRVFADYLKITDPRLRTWEDAAPTYGCNVNGTPVTP